MDRSSSDAPRTGGDEAFSPREEGNRLADNVGWWIALALIVLASFYGGLLLVSYVMQPELQRLAYFEEDELRLEGYAVPARPSDSVRLQNASSDELYLQALAHLRAAQTSTWGFFPRFDEESLQRAAALLEHVTAREEEDAFLQLEAYYLLGKIRLAQGRRKAARLALLEVVEGKGRKADPARELLRGMASQGGEGE